MITTGSLYDIFNISVTASFYDYEANLIYEETGIRYGQGVNSLPDVSALKRPDLNGSRYEFSRWDKSHSNLRIDTAFFPLYEADFLFEFILRGQRYDFSGIDSEYQGTIKEFVFPDVIQVAGAKRHLHVIDSDSFNGDTSIESIAFQVPGNSFDREEYVVRLGYNTFAYAQALREIIFPSTMFFEYAASSNFAHTENLERVVFPMNLDVISDLAFNDSGIISLENVDHIKTIKRQAFGNTKRFKGTYFRNLSFLGDNAFYNASALEWLIIPKDCRFENENMHIGYNANPELQLFIDDIRGDAYVDSLPSENWKKRNSNETFAVYYQNEWYFDQTLNRPVPLI